MHHLRRLGNSMPISIPADEDGFTGRECPQRHCKGYFKIELGTGLEGEGLECHCPYCGHVAGHSQFTTKEQVEYAKSVASREIMGAIRKDLKRMEFDDKPKGPFGIGISMKVKPSRLPPIHYYRETRLETEVVCNLCTLRYSVYGVFAFCPDCGHHNSLQILNKNVEVVGKMLEIAKGEEKAVAEKLIESALENCVSAFDAYGRELCHLHADQATNPIRARGTSFQNLEGARSNLLKLFGMDLSSYVRPEEWREAVMAFQKRHLFTHKLGVVDQDYLKRSGDTHAVLGRKIGIGVAGVDRLTTIVHALAQGLSASFQRLRG